MAADRPLLADGVSHPLMADGTSYALMATVSGPGTPPDPDPTPYRFTTHLDARRTTRL